MKNTLLVIAILSSFVISDDGSHPMGSWKDIKYCAKFIKDKTSDTEHPLIIHICKLLCGQLNADWTKFQNYKANPEDVKPILSLAARWCPR